MSIRREKIQWLGRRLLDFFKKVGREHLPWRREGISAYEVWVSEVMLQQTQVSRVIGYYERFLKRFPTVKHLAKANWEEFLPYYAGLGYYARGRNMLETAKVVVKEYKGKFPAEIALLEKLPGIGPYTARAIASFAYGNSHLAWDTNLERVIGRFFRGGKFLLTEDDKQLIERELSSKARDLNASLMDFGSVICLSRPKCAACMLRSHCRYYREGGRGERKKAQKKLVKRKRNSELIERAIVFLHVKHEKYYSAKKSHFEPFILPQGYLDRAAIKEYFFTHFGLTLSVRPPHQKQVKQGTIYSIVNAQILLGKPPFRTFPKEVKLRYTQGRI